MQPKYLALLQTLHRYDIRFIVVGGVAAILEGAPITTLDVDIVFEKEAENIQRLANALASIHARYRDPAGRHIEPTADRLSRYRVNLLQTDFGPLDILESIGHKLTYTDLTEHTHQRTLADLQIRVLDLAKLIEVKEIANREKDRAVLPVLRRTLEMRQSHD